MKFQSTPSARRATRHLGIIEVGFQNFNPRPPRGGRREIYPCKPDIFEFQSTPSARRATTSESNAVKYYAHFNPRPPRGGRPEHQHL